MFLPYQTLLAQPLDAHIALIAFNRPQNANALNMQMALELADAFDTLNNTSHGLRVVILTGQGKHFCAGADLKERQGMDVGAWHAQHESFERALHSLMDCPLPVIAAVGGAAYGGGLELALACDFIYASDNARFALSEASLGIMPGMGGSQTLPRRIGMARAKELALSARAFSAQDAWRYGLVNALHSTDTLLFEAMQTAKTIAQNAPLSVRAIKGAMNKGITLELEDALKCELSHYHSLLATKDRQEGINAFNDKRKPTFRGE